MRPRPLLTALSAVVAAAVLAVAVAPSAASASAVDACPGVGPVTTLIRDGSWLESSVFDASGHLVYTDVPSGRVSSLDSPVAPVRRVGTVRLPGGMALTPGGRIAVASGNTWGRLFGGVALFLIDPATGAKTKVASGLVAANGLARAADGTTYTADQVASQIDRVLPDGTVKTGWWRGAGGTNGLALTADGRTLYVALANAARIVAIDTTTRAARTVFVAPGLLPLPDGLTVDRTGRLYVAMFVSGEVLRVDPATGGACRLARGFTRPSSVAIPPASGPFDPQSVYVTTANSVKQIRIGQP